MSSIQQWASAADTEPWTKVNGSLLALAGAFTFAAREAAHSGLVVGIGGGPFNGATVADTTVTCTDNTTNYIVALRSTGAISTSTATTNWNDPLYGRVARAVFASGVLSYFDERLGPSGIFTSAGTATRVGMAFEKEIALSDLTTALTAGTTKGYWRPAFAATGVSARLSLRVSSSSGLPTVDMNKNTVSMMSTKLSIDVGETTSLTAATPVVMSSTTWAIDDLIEFDIDIAGTGAMGAIITVTGQYA